MADNVIPFGGVTRLDISSDRVLEANVGEFSGVVLIGWTPDGEFRFASNLADGGEVLWLLEKAKQALMNVNIEEPS